jgi:hypothetical protein
LRVSEGGTAPEQRAPRRRDPLAAVYCGTASYAQFVRHNYDEAMRFGARGRPAVRRSRWRASDINRGRRMAGRSHRRAGKAVQEPRRTQPNISLGWIAEQMPIQQ